MANQCAVAVHGEVGKCEIPRLLHSRHLNVCVGASRHALPARGVDFGLIAFLIHILSPWEALCLAEGKGSVRGAQK